MSLADSIWNDGYYEAEDLQYDLPRGQASSLFTWIDRHNLLETTGFDDGAKARAAAARRKVFGEAVCTVVGHDMRGYSCSCCDVKEAYCSRCDYWED